jgi:small GTP-binding protein
MVYLHIIEKHLVFVRNTNFIYFIYYMVDREVELKLILLGDINTGKSSLVERIKYGPDLSRHQHISTIGIDFCIFDKYLEKEDYETKYTIQMWDAGGNKSFINIVRSFFNKVVGAIVLYDISSLDSFQRAKEFVEEYKKFNNYYSYIFLIANKTDLDRKITYDEGKNYADSINAMFLEISVKYNQNIDQIFHILLEKINYDLQHNILIPNSKNLVKVYYPLKINDSRSALISERKIKKNVCCCSIQ